NYKETRLGQGRDNVKNYLQDNPEFCAEIEKLVRENADQLQAPKKKKGAAAGGRAKAQTISIDAEADDEE
ncbi:MAG: DNA recombination/repair protein RecA, partial [Oscillospiraceae bacterium]|nr:DNA recombination/repair protein RecA [Oscillospiraceae bacterium]